jgi:hypothetical protein
MDDTSGQLIFAVGMAVALGVIWIGLEKAAERWKWFRFIGIGALLLIFVTLTVLAVRTFMQNGRRIRLHTY